MKRKTNLFYLSGADSNFLTFSNYAESLTGNYLSTDTKLFCATFLCIEFDYLIKEEGMTVEEWCSTDTEGNITGEYPKRKAELIGFLAAYYENKLAFLRDKCIENNELIEKKLLPLNYLLDAFNLFCALKTKEQGKEYSFSIKYVGETSEHQYNGVYSDNICIIDTGEYSYGTVILDPSFDTTTVEKYEYPVSETTYLYGWTDADNNYRGPKEYTYTSPFVDSIIRNAVNGESGTTYTYSYYYFVTSNVTGIQLTRSTDSIAFNMLIPLYDTVNINADTNTNIINEDNEIANKEVISLSNNDNLYISNVPLGIWFSGEEEVTLNRTNNYNYYPSWSLVISSQFKPFPYSEKMPTESDKNTNALAFQTYSEILIKQNQLIDSLLSFQTQLNDIKKSVNDIQARLNTATSYALDDIHTDIIKYKNAIDEKVEYLENYVNDIANNQYVWKQQK